MRLPRHYIPAMLLLVVLTIIGYSDALRNGFTNYDDDVYVTDNAVVRRGLTPEGAEWALTTRKGSNWHPVTWFSHMTDVSVGGMNPALHHATSAFIHCINVLLLFFIFHRMTGAVWRSMFVAGVFSLHPLHVESVAWIAERKDVLSAFFGLVAILAYLRYVQRPSSRRMIVVAGFMLMGLLSKPTMVMLPIMLLLIDYWPLGRWNPPGSKSGLLYQEGKQSFGGPSSSSLSLFKEKIPLFVLSAASGVVTLIVQQRGGSMRFAETIPFAVRIANALISYVRYIAKTFWPADLTVFYPYPPDGYPVAAILGAAAVLLMATYLVYRLRRSNPYLLTGWLWFLCMLVPVAGFIQVGWQSMADRYMYVPLIGLSVMVAWGTPALFKTTYPYSAVPAILASIVMAGMMLVTKEQIRYWQNSETLFTHAVDVTSGNWIAYTNLGVEAQERGDTLEAFRYYREALRIRPDDVITNRNLGILFQGMGKTDSAMARYQEAIRQNPHYPMVQYDYAYLIMRTGNLSEAAVHFRKAIEDNPYDIRPRYLLGKILVEQSDYDSAIKEFSAVLRIVPGFSPASEGLANARAKLKNAPK